MRVSVRIVGRDYALRGDASAEHLRRVAAEVDRRITELMARQARLGIVEATVLASLNLCEELFRLQGEYRRLLELTDREMRSRRGRREG